MHISTKVFIVLAAFLVIWGVFNQAVATRAGDSCEPFDKWVGLPRYDYQTHDGVWNLPADSEVIDTLSFQTGGVWVYWSESEKSRYIIVFIDFEPSGDPPGTHHICVYKD